MMKDEMVLIVRLRVERAARNLLRDHLMELFDQIRHEDTFISATVLEDVQDPEQLLVYEIWRETLESFLANQMAKPYRGTYEKLILDLKVERTPQVLRAVGSWHSKG